MRRLISAKCRRKFFAYTDFSERGRNKNARVARGRGRGWACGRRAYAHVRRCVIVMRATRTQVPASSMRPKSPHRRPCSTPVPPVPRSSPASSRDPGVAQSACCCQSACVACRRPGRIAIRSEGRSDRVRDDWERGGNAGTRIAVEKMCLCGPPGCAW